MSKINHHNSYPVFCIAMYINSQEGEKYKNSIDILWDEAILHYNKFLYSEYNSLNQSELECINEYMQSEFNKYSCISTLLENIHSYIVVATIKKYLIDEIGLTNAEAMIKLSIAFYDENNIPIRIDIDNLTNFFETIDYSICSYLDKLDDFERYLFKRYLKV